MGIEERAELDDPYWPGAAREDEDESEAVGLDTGTELDDPY